MTDEIRAIREEELPECLALWKRVWPENRPGFFERYFYGDPDFQPEYTRVALLDDSIISAVQIVKRIISCGELTLTVGGIANVATDPHYRGHGFAGRCLYQAISVMEADALDLSLLFTGEHEFYARAGYEPIEARRLAGELRPEPVKPFTRMIVRPYEDRDDAAIHLVHVAFNRERPLAVRRSPAYWRDWIGWWQGIAPGRATVAEHEGVVVGYCLAMIDEDAGRMRVREIGVREGAEKAIDALLDEVAVTARAHHIATLILPLDQDVGVMESAARLLVDSSTEPSLSGMIRFLHLDNLFRGLAPVLTERWRRCGSPEGKLEIQNPYGVISISSDGKFLRITPVSDVRLVHSESSGPLNQAATLDLLTGKGLHVDRLPPAQMRFANALFPPRLPWFWELDGF